MKKIVFVAIVSALSFLAGLIVNSSSQARVTEASKQIPFSSSHKIEAGNLRQRNYPATNEQ